jgi:predicted dehydrogenase
MRGFTRIECVGRYPAPGGGFPSPKAPVGWIRGHVTSYYTFLNAVHTGIQAGPSFADAASVQAVLETAYRSAETGRMEEVLR